MSEDFGNGAIREVHVRGHRLLSGPTAGMTNKFVVTEAQAWFLPFEDNTQAPRLYEMLVAIFGEALNNEEFSDELDAQLEDGRLLLGYVRESGEVEIHSLVGAANSATRARIREVFGREVGTIWDDLAGGGARPDEEGER